MANETQLAQLRASIAENNRCATWNRWRGENPNVKIDLTGADLTGADLYHADLIGADLSDAFLRGAYLGDANLNSATLTGAYLIDAVLINAYLIGAVLTHANLRDANLTHAYLSDANLTRAYLGGTNLSGANLTRANLTGATLTNADLTGATLTGVEFTNTRIYSTRLGDLDLRSVMGLAAVVHQGPSHLATDTLYASHGEIPDSFLRGCGLPDEMIGFVHSIAGAIQYYSAFISYNHEDEAFATRLYNDLQANNVRCWKYTEYVKIGHDILARVDEAIRLHEKLIVILSEHSIQSDWVESEVEVALEREQQEGKEVLFPVTLDDAVKHLHFGWAAKLRRRRNIGDFGHWKDQDQYQPMFDRLLRDLKADTR